MMAIGCRHKQLTSGPVVSCDACIQGIGISPSDSGRVKIAKEIMAVIDTLPEKERPFIGGKGYGYGYIDDSAHTLPNLLKFNNGARVYQSVGIFEVELDPDTRYTEISDSTGKIIFYKKDTSENIYIADTMAVIKYIFKEVQRQQKEIGELNHNYSHALNAMENASENYVFIPKDTVRNWVVY